MRVIADLHPTRKDRISLVSPYTAKDLIRQAPGARWSKDDSAWSVPLAWTSCLALRGIFGEGLEVGEGLHKWSWELYRDVIEPAMALRDSLGEDIDGDGRLYSFQRAGVKFLTLVKRAILDDEMGTGKTVQTILALKALRESGAYEKQILVVCPNTMKFTWQRELKTWWPEVTAQVVAGTAAQRRKQIASGAEVIIMNWEALRTHSRLAPFGSYALKKCVECGGSGTVRQAQCEVHERELNTMQFGAVVADEVHRAKDPSSSQTRALRAASGEAKIRFGLTGTPIANDVTELWSILHWVDEQEWPAKTAWVERLVDMVFNIWGGREIRGIKPGLETEFHSGIDPKMRRMTKAVVLPFLPPIVTERRDVEMHPKQAKAYEEMRDLLIAKLDAGVLMAANPMVQVGRLMQLASSYGDLYITKVPVKASSTHLVPINPDTGLPRHWNAERSVDSNTGQPMVNFGDKLIDPVTGDQLYKDEEHLKLTDPSSKLDAYMGDLDDFGNASTIVFAESRQLIEMLSARMNKAGIMHGLITGAISEAERERNIANFQESYTQFILCTLKAGGVGITLTKASAVMNLQRSWSSVDMTQAIARAHRIGSEQHDSILVVDYVTPGTVELAQIAALARKGANLEEVVRDEALLRKMLMGEPVV